MKERIWHKAYGKGVPVDLSFDEIVLPDLVRRSVEKFPDRPAVHFMNGTLTYRELLDQVERLATALSDLGIGKDGRVAIHLPNLPQTVIASYAVLFLGAQAVMTNPMYVEREIEHQWKDAGCTVAITTDFLFDRMLKGIRDRLPVKHFIIASIPEYLRFPIKQLAPLKLKKADPPLIAKVDPGPGIYFFRKLVNETAPKPPRPDIDFEDLALLQYTGGTTGVAKGAMLTHKNLSSNVQQLIAWFPSAESGKEVVLGALPFFHIFGFTVAMTFANTLGAALVLAPNPRDIPALIKSINKHKVTLFPAVPAMFNAINQYPGVDKIDIGSVKSCFSGSAPLPLDVQQRFEELTGCKIVEGFGMTETSPVTHANPLGGVRKIGTIGIPVCGTDARIVDAETGKTELALGEEGELLVRGPQVMKGYWKRPDETEKILKDGWLSTGDLAAIDEDGYFIIMGRKKDMIIASGYNIYPDEIDKELIAHPAIVECCTIGVPDPKRGESVKAFVVLTEGESVTEEAIIAFLKDKLAPYKIPKMIEFRKDLPKSSMMKLLRRELREEELKKLSRK